MIVKCRGYEGTLINLESELFTCRDATGGFSCVDIIYDIEILGEDGVKHTIHNVRGQDLEVVNG